jgi:putative transposase
MSKRNLNIDKKFILSQRKSIRLKNYDYSMAGLYFITICTQDKKHRFGTIKNNEIILNEYGQIAQNEWIELKNRFKTIELHEFIIMPNHIHGIMEITVGATLAVAQNETTVAQNETTVAQNETTVAQNETTVAQNETTVAQNENVQNGIIRNIRAGASPAPTVHTVSDMVGAYKSLVTNKCLNIYKSKNETMGKLWQRNYYEHIIRNEKSYLKISEYIKNNPIKWKEDKYF